MLHCSPFGVTIVSCSLKRKQDQVCLDDKLVFSKKRIVSTWAHTTNIVRIVCIVSSESESPASHLYRCTFFSSSDRRHQHMAQLIDSESALIQTHPAHRTEYLLMVVSRGREECKDREQTHWLKAYTVSAATTGETFSLLLSCAIPTRYSALHQYADDTHISQCFLPMSSGLLFLAMRRDFHWKWISMPVNATPSNFHTFFLILLFCLHS